MSESACRLVIVRKGTAFGKMMAGQLLENADAQPDLDEGDEILETIDLQRGGPLINFLRALEETDGQIDGTYPVQALADLLTDVIQSFRRHRRSPGNWGYRLVFTPASRRSEGVELRRLLMKTEENPDPALELGGEKRPIVIDLDNEYALIGYFLELDKQNVLLAGRFQFQQILGNLLAEVVESQRKQRRKPK